MCRCNEKMEEWEDGKMEKSGKESPHGCSHESMGGKDKAGRNVGRRICGYRSKNPDRSGIGGAASCRAVMVYSARDNDGYLTKMSIEAMRSELAHDIFRQDFANIYDKQNQARTEMKEESADVIKQLMEEMKSGMVKNMELEKMLLALSGKLSHTKGKKVYGYLKRDVKNLVDRIIDEIAEDERVDALYKEWNKWQGEIRKFYENSPEKQVPLSQCAAFKSLKNLVISEVMQISHNVRSTEWIQGEVAVREPSVFFATVRLMTGLQKIFQEEFRKENRTGRYHIDRKRRKKLTEKRRAQGHRTDDHEPEQQIEG